MREVVLFQLESAQASFSEIPDDPTRALVSPLLDPLFQRHQRTGVQSAWYGHVPFAHWIVAASRPRLLVELGTHNGVSYAAFCEALAQVGGDGRAFAIDTWQGDEHAGHYGDDVYWDLRGFHDERFGGFSELLRCTFAEAVPYFADGSIDLLHVDGLHTYEAVRADWEAWRPKLSDRAVVLFHDTNVRERDFGVWRLWAELRAQHPGFEFLHGHGLGMLAYGPCAPEPARALCALSGPREIGAVRERFALLGERWVEGAERRLGLAARQKAEADLAGARAEIASARAVQDRLAATRAEVEGERDASRREAARLAAELEPLRASGAALTAERDALRDGLDRALAEQASAREASARDGAERDALRADLVQVTAERDRLRHELDASRGEGEREHAQLAELRRHHHAVVSSTSWRATAPVRRIGGRFPRLARGASRAATLGALAMTGRLPSRIRLRRQVREDADLLAATPLFDRARYLERYPTVAEAGADPLWHYIWTGAASGCDPHPLFDSRWYLGQHPELSARQVNPLAHYLREGAALGWDPHPLFDTAFYVAQAPEAAGQNALLHFVSTGAPQGLDPNPFFDMDAYWEEYLRGRDLADDPLSHYVLRGAASGCDPHPLFDTDWYARAHPDSAGWNPLAHYLREGRQRGYAPCLLAAQSAELPPPLRFTPRSSPDVSIIVPTYGRLFDTVRCLTSIMVHSGSEVSYEVIVADDRPDAPIAPRLRDIPGLRVEQNPRNLGFLRSCNHAAGLAAGRYLLFLNNDTQVHPGWLAPLVALADRDPRVGIVGSKLLNADGTVQEAGGIMHRNGWGFPYGRGGDPEDPRYNFVREVDVAIGACLLVRASAWDAVGGFDDRYAPAYYEEFDLAFALRERGWRVLYQPASRVTHFDSSSYGPEQRDRQSTVNHGKFCRKWQDALSEQPAPEAPPFLARERRAAGGRLLMVDDTVPEPDKHAGAVTVFNWLRLMREAGVAITYAPFNRERPQPYTAALEQMGIEVLYGDVDLPAWLAENGSFLDWVWAARPEVAQPLLDAVERFVPSRLVYYTHDLHFLREQRRYELEGDDRRLQESRRLKALERDIFRRARVVVTPSADEVPAIEALAPGADVRVVPAYPWPASPLASARAESFAGRDAVLFVGGYAHAPNVDAALWLAREIMSLVWRDAPRARLLLAGSRPPAEVLALAAADERIEVPGWVPDLSPLYARARLSISPLRYGAGVKGKIVSSLQAGVPVVTTAIGNEGLALRDGVEALVGDTASALAAGASALLRDPGLCATLADAGAAVLRRRFGEDGARHTLMAILGQAVCPACGDRRPASGAGPPAPPCRACGADGCDGSLAEAAIRPWRPLSVSSLREAAPLLASARVRVPAGPLADALGRGADAGGELDLLVSRAYAAGDGALVRPGGRWVFAGRAEALGAVAAELVDQGWEVRLHETGSAVVEASRGSA